MEEGTKFKVSDIATATYLSMSGLTFTPEKQGPRVFFCFEQSPALYKALQDFNMGALVNVEEYSRELRRLRALMYQTKGPA